MVNYWTIGREYESPDPYPTRWVRITPELARVILETQNTNNRRKKLVKIRKMARAMERGRFLHTHQGIAFDAEGTLLDGQNRLQAVVDSGVTVWLKVTYNLPSTAQSEMDNGTRRTQSENLQFGEGLDVTDLEVRIANCMYGRGTRVDLGTDEAAEFLAGYIDAIRFSNDAFPGGKLRKGINSPCFAVVARAYYTVDHDDLRRFGSIVCGGPFSVDESAASQLGRQLRGETSKRRIPPAEVFAITQRALRDFIARTPRKVVRPLWHNEFPLPHEMESDEAGLSLKIA